MTEKRKRFPAKAVREDEKARHLEALLDEALEQTFPASDPIAVDVPHDHRRPSTPAEAEGSNGGST